MVAAKYLRRYVTAVNLVSGEERWCLWLKGASREDLRKSPEIKRRLAEVGHSRRVETERPPWRFGEDTQPRGYFLVFPRLLPRNFSRVSLFTIDTSTVVNDQVWIINDGSMVTAGVVSSHIYRVWVDMTASVDGETLRIGSSTTHNTFPCPDIDASQKSRIEEAARQVLLARSYAIETTLDDLYVEGNMPKPLRAAHDELDAVMADVFGIDVDASDAEIRDVLSQLYRLRAA